MYKTKMIKVYLTSFQLCIFSLIVNLLVLGLKPLPTVAQDPNSADNNKQAANNAPVTIEPEILSEINRVRTNPQGYARWLEEQRQYYDGIWLKLPGEKPIRTNRGLRALEEAIAILQEQQPLPPLSQSEATAANASNKLANFATSNNIQYISYGRTTPKGIVMSLVVDELFPDRRRRQSLLSPNADNTGVVCKSDPTYAKVCAIAYSDSPVEPAEANPEPAPETQTTASNPEAPRAKPEPVNNTESSASVPDDTAEEETTTEALPAPPVTPTPSTPPTPNVPEVDTSDSETEASPTEDSQDEVAQTDSESEESEENEELEEPEDVEEEEVPQDEEEPEELEEEETPQDEEESEDVEEEVPQDDEELEDVEEDSEEDTEVFEAEEDSGDVAVNSDSSRILENVERGRLEQGDLTIAEDGSFYDSYPLEAKSDESFIIYLESEEFDAFVALVDAQGNIVEQNDDIDEENSNSRIRVTIPEDGVYNVIVNAYDQGGTGEYVLTIRR